MDRFRERLLACPACGRALSAAWSCDGCLARFEVADGIPNLRLPADARTETVREFYDRAPFPGYPAGERLQALWARAERSPFARLLDRAIPGDAHIVDIGCGTGQMCLYLARADRLIVGADLTRASLQLGAAAAARFGLDRRSIRRDRSAAARVAARRLRCGVFVRRAAPHTGPARVVRQSRAACAPGRRDRGRRLQRVRADPDATPASRRAPVGLSAGALRSGPSRSRP